MKYSKFFFLIFIVNILHGQKFIEEIKIFKKQDSISLPSSNTILFLGSSSFKMWKNLKTYFPKHKIINRGFGGSSLLDQIVYASDLLLSYKPKQIIIYCGENDFADNDSLLASQVAERFFTLFNTLRYYVPLAQITYISIKPSPLRKHLMEKFNQTNMLIKAFMKNQKNAFFIDIYSLMITPNGTPIEDFFLEDKLHMNARGYAIWQRMIEPILLN